MSFERFIGKPVQLQFKSHNNLTHHVDTVIEDINVDDGYTFITHQNGKVLMFDAEIQVTPTFITFTETNYWSLVVQLLP